MVFNQSVLAQFTPSSEPADPGLGSEHDSKLEKESGQEERLEGEESGRWFLFKEVVFSGAYYIDGMFGLPPDDLQPRPFRTLTKTPPVIILAWIL